MIGVGKPGLPDSPSLSFPKSVVNIRIYSSCLSGSARNEVRVSEIAEVMDSRDVIGKCGKRHRPDELLKAH